MNNIKNFEQFNESVINEGKFRKFLTGHDDSESKEGAKNKILADIDKNIAKMIEAGHLSEDNANVKKESLIKQAEENNWKGKVKIVNSRSGRVVLTYIPGTSGLQNLGRSAASSVKSPL